MDTSSLNTTGIYGIYCKDSDVYSKTLEFQQGLIGSILAEDNSCVVLYNSIISSNYIEAHKNSNIYYEDVTLNTKYPIYKAQDNTFVNFPMPIYDANSTNILKNSTGFNTDNIAISNLSGKATSILYNNGFEFYLSKLKNGMFLSDITINTTSYTQLKNYLEYLPRNLNGFNLNIILDNTEIIQLKTIDDQKNRLIINNFYGGIVSLSLKSIDKQNNYRITASINHCENIIIKDSINVQYDINLTPDIHLEKGTKFTNVLFSVDSANIFGENIEFNYTNILTEDIKLGISAFDDEYYGGNYGDIYEQTVNKETFYLNIFALRGGSKCFIDNSSTINANIASGVITKFTVDNNSQATWLSGDFTNIKEFMDENNQTIAWHERSEFPNAVNELNHQHIYAEVEKIDDMALSSTYIGYPVAWYGDYLEHDKLTFTSDDLTQLLTPLPNNWTPVKVGLSNNYITLSKICCTELSGLQYLLGRNVQFYVPLFATHDSSDGDVSTIASWNIKSADNMRFLTTFFDGDQYGQGYTYVRFDIGWNDSNIRQENIDDFKQQYKNLRLNFTVACSYAKPKVFMYKYNKNNGPNKKLTAADLYSGFSDTVKYNKDGFLYGYYNKNSCRFDYYGSNSGGYRLNFSCNLRRTLGKLFSYWILGFTVLW